MREDQNWAGVRIEVSRDGVERLAESVANLAFSIKRLVEVSKSLSERVDAIEQVAQLPKNLYWMDGTTRRLRTKRCVLCEEDRPLTNFIYDEPDKCVPCRTEGGMQ